jgi:hypothetical protein
MSVNYYNVYSVIRVQLCTSTNQLAKDCSSHWSNLSLGHDLHRTIEFASGAWCYAAGSSQIHLALLPLIAESLVTGF